jgi:hypothetical protein
MIHAVAFSCDYPTLPTSVFLTSCCLFVLPCLACCICDVVVSLVTPKAAIGEMMVNGLTPQTVVAMVVTFGVPMKATGVKMVHGLIRTPV